MEIHFLKQSWLMHQQSFVHLWAWVGVHQHLCQLQVDVFLWMQLLLAIHDTESSLFTSKSTDFWCLKGGGVCWCPDKRRNCNFGFLTNFILTIVLIDLITREKRWMEKKKESRQATVHGDLICVTRSKIPIGMSFWRVPYPEDSALLRCLIGANLVINRSLALGTVMVMVMAMY